MLRDAGDNATNRLTAGEWVCMLLIIAIVLLVLWGSGFAFRVAGGLIHLLLAIALILFLIQLVGGRG